MKRFLIIFISTFLILPFVQAQDAGQILSRMDDIMFSPKDKQGEVKITLLDKSRKGKIRVAEMFQKGTDKKLYRYLEPENQAGIATLSLPDDIMWLYMPAFGKPKKISLLAKSQAFTGTDFSYEDMATTPYATRFTPTLIESDENSNLLELTPMSNKSNYSKILVRLNKEHGYPITMDYYNKGGVHFKTAEYKYLQNGKYWYAEEVLMTDLKKEHSTRIEMYNVKFDQGLDDSLFDVENLPIEKKDESNQ